MAQPSTRQSGRLEETGGSTRLDEVTIAGSSFAVAVGLKGQSFRRNLCKAYDVAVGSMCRRDRVYSNYPNPFNPWTVIGISFGGQTCGRIIDVLGGK